MSDTKDFVCPLPPIWNDIYGKLGRIAEQRNLPKPPVPLILAGWWASTDLDKMLRWQKTIAWADEHGLQDQIPELTDEQKHYFGSAW